MKRAEKSAVEMTVPGKPQTGLPHNLGNRCAIPTFPPPGYCYIRQEILCLKGASLSA